MKIIISIIVIVILQLFMTSLLRRERAEDRIHRRVAVTTPLSEFGVITGTSYDKSGFTVEQTSDFVTAPSITAPNALPQGRLTGDFQFRLWFDNLTSTVTLPAEKTHDNRTCDDLIFDIREALKNKGLQNEITVSQQGGQVVLSYNIFRGAGSEKYPVPALSIVKTERDRAFGAFGFADSVSADRYDLIIAASDRGYPVDLSRAVPAHSSEVTLAQIDREIQNQTEKRISLLQRDGEYGVTKSGGVILVEKKREKFTVAQTNNSRIAEKLGLTGTFR